MPGEGQVRAFAAFLRDHHLPAVAQEFLKLARELQLAQFETCDHPVAVTAAAPDACACRSADVLLVASLQETADFLERVAAGTLVVKAAGDLRAWLAGEAQIKPAGGLTPTELLRCCSAHVRSLLPFVPIFTTEVAEATAIALTLAQLESAIQELACETLQSASRGKDEFLSVLSHELRTPLNAITGFGSILEAGIAGALNETQLEYVRHLLESSESMLSLLNDLLDMSALQAGKFPLVKAPVQLGRVIQTVRDHLSALADRRGIRLELAIAGKLPDVEADARSLEQVLMNLVGNALKFTPAGGHVAVSVEREGDEVVCAVKDTGPGIAREDLPKLFGRFEQLYKAPRKERGTGLGLSIARSLIAAHGGVIGVSSEPGQGSVFWFRLPIVADG